MDDTIYIEISNAEEEGELQKIASFTLPKWKLFCDNLERMQKAVKNYTTRGREGAFRLHLGSNQYVHITTGFACVDIRRWYVSPTTAKLLSSKNGIALKLDDFQELCDRLKDLN